MKEIDSFMRERINRILKGHAKRCAYCGVVFHQSDEKTIDHINPKKHSGDERANNKLVCCKNCNSQKGCRPVKEFKKIVNKENLINYLRDFGKLQMPTGEHYQNVILKRFRLTPTK